MFTALLMFAVTVAADGPKLSDEAKKELAKMEGKWRFVEWVREGTSMKPAAEDDIAFEIKGGRVKVMVDGKVVQEAEVASLDPTPDPKILDMKSRPANPKRDPLTEEGIYKFEKGRLYICVYKGKDKRRPTNFDTNKQENMELFVLERAKE